MSNQKQKTSSKPHHSSPSKVSKPSVQRNTKPINRKPASTRKAPSKRTRKKGLVTFGRTLMVIGVTLLILIVFVFLVGFILIKGPSPDAGILFARSAHETSAVKWLPRLYLSEKEYDAILNPVSTNEDSFVLLPQATSITNPDDGSAVALDSAFEANTPSQEFNSDIEIIDLKGTTYKGKLMLIHDPSRVYFACIDSFGNEGITLSQFLERYDALACTNAGGFEDEGGTGRGGIPDGIVIKNGQIVYGSAGGYYKGLAGFDENHKLIVGNMSGSDALFYGIKNGTNFADGAVLIKDGVRQTGFVSGINPRTCVGQAADGTVLLVAVEGRFADSLGATIEDLADIMETYGAINAVNMDGGSSSGMYYEGERITRSCSVVGDRPLPTAILVSR